MVMDMLKFAVMGSVLCHGFGPVTFGLPLGHSDSALRGLRQVCAFFYNTRISRCTTRLAQPLVIGCSKMVSLVHLFACRWSPLPLMRRLSANEF